MSAPNPPRRPLATFLRPAPAQPAPPADDAAAAAAAEDAVHAAPPAAPDVVAPGGEASPADPVDDAPPVTAVTAPGFLRAPATRLRTPRWQWIGIAVLAVLLMLQIVLADRARLAADAGSRPWLATLCGALRCTLPAWHEPSAFTMVSRDVRPLPGQPGTLQVLASLRNDARWAQAWPQLRLSLADADGRVVGSAVFSPQQYLGDNADARGLIEPGQSAQVAFRVREPAASTVAFTFEFL